MIPKRSSWACLYLAVVFIGAALASQERRKWTSLVVHCKDVGDKCGLLSSAGYCVLVPGYMFKLCMRSCNMCGRKQTYGGWNVHLKHTDNPH